MLLKALKKQWISIFQTRNEEFSSLFETFLILNQSYKLNLLAKSEVFTGKSQNAVRPRFNIFLFEAHNCMFFVYFCKVYVLPCLQIQLYGS